MIAPYYIELSEKHPSLMFLSVDVDELTVSYTPPSLFYSFFDLIKNNYVAFCIEIVNGMLMQDFSTQWDIKATPTFFFLRNGEQFDKLVGANKPELLKKINAIVDSEPPRHAV